MEARTIWTRVGHWFRPMMRGTLTDHLPRTDGDGLLEPVPNPNDGNGSKGLFPLSRRGNKQALLQLEQGYRKLTGLVDSIHRHLEARDERSRRVADALAQMARTVAQLPPAAQGQRDQLASVAEQLECSNRRLAGWDSTLKRVPELIEAQRETLSAVGEQFEASRSTNARVAESVADFSKAVGALEQTYGASVDTLKDLQRSLDNREERMTDMLAAQNRRFSRLLIGAVALAAALWIAALIVPVVR